MTEETAHFGLWMKARRKVLDLTQQELADRVGCSNSAIRMIEKGQRKPSRQVATLLADALGIPTDERDQFLREARDTNSPQALTNPKEPAPRPLNNLPSQPTSLIGRETEMASLTGMLSQGSARLVTVVGPPGIGKTRLAVSVAEKLLATDLFPDGVFMVSLAPVRDEAGVTRAIAAAMGLRDPELGGISARVHEHLRVKRMLLLLDNFEQVVAAAPLISDLLAHSPHLKVLVTSRESLHLRGERQFPVPPLRVPGGLRSGDKVSRTEDDESTPLVEQHTAIGTFSSIALFVERAREIDPGFTLHAENAVAVSAICARLDGLPLAIELVAARVRLLPPGALLAQLVGHDGKGATLPLLTGGARDLPDRHRTLRDAISWSYELLNDAERRIFNRMVVFVGGCTLTSAEAVCDATGDLGISVVEGLSSLLDKNLIKREGGQREEVEPRYTMLDIMREYAWERLEESGEADKVRGWLVEYYMALAQAAKPNIYGEDQKAWMLRLDRELDNIQEALRWAIDSGKIESAANMALALSLFWYMRGHLQDGADWLQELVEHKERGSLPPEVQAELLSSLGHLEIVRYRFEHASRVLNEALALSRQVGNKSMTASNMNSLGAIELLRGNYYDSERWLGEAITQFRELGKHRSVGIALHTMAVMLFFRGDAEVVEQLETEAVPLLEKAGDKWHVALALSIWGMALSRIGHMERAEAMCNHAMSSLEGLEELGGIDDNSPGVALALTCKADVARYKGEFQMAAELYQESLAVGRAAGSLLPTSRNLVGLGLMSTGRAAAERATIMLGLLEALGEQLNALFVTPVDEPEHKESMHTAKTELGEDVWKQAWERGRAMSLDEAVAFALAKNNDAVQLP